MNQLAGHLGFLRGIVITIHNCTANTRTHSTQHTHRHTAGFKIELKMLAMGPVAA
jgi:hypothetical protein